MLVSPLSPDVDTLTPSVMVFGDGASGRRSGLDEVMQRPVGTQEQGRAVRYGWRGSSRWGDESQKHTQIGTRDGSLEEMEEKEPGVGRIGPNPGSAT